MAEHRPDARPNLKWIVCDENGAVLREYFNQDDAFEHCNWSNGETVTFTVLKETK